MKYVILTNILTPYRRFFYDELYKMSQQFQDEFHVILMAETESNRNWKYDDYKTAYTELLKSKTITISNIFIHINLGLKSVLLKYKPDLVICAGSYIYPSVWRAIQLSKKLNYRVFLWSESHLEEAREYGRIKMLIRETIRKMVLSKFDGFWFAGNLAKKFDLVYCSESSHFIFVPNLIDSKKFSSVNEYTSQEREQLRSKYNIPLDKRVFLLPARLSKVKGIIEFLDIFKDVRNRENVIIVIAGDGELEVEINRYINENCLGVVLLGYKPEKEMLDLYAIADLLLMPSLSDPNPLTIIEACWCKLPLLVSEHVGNYPETVINGQNGYVFSYQDKENAIKIIEECINNDCEWYYSAGQKSFEIANSIYNPETAIPRLVEESRAYIEKNMDNHKRDKR